jgi:AraC family transcriptional regulator
MNESSAAAASMQARASASSEGGVIRSSASTSWNGFLVATYWAVDGYCAEPSPDWHFIWQLTSATARAEKRTGISGRMQPLSKSRGAISIVPAGPVPELRLLTPSLFACCGLAKDFTKRIEEEMDKPPCALPAFESGVTRPTMGKILGLLVDELEAGAPTGALYADSLAHALAVRFLLTDNERVSGIGTCASALPPHVLNRVKERIESDIGSDHSLDELAQESGYSRWYFASMFRAATGMTPHRYLVERRVIHAQHMLTKQTCSLAQIAHACGFANQAHMTNVFRKYRGITPGELRRTCRA